MTAPAKSAFQCRQCRRFTPKNSVFGRCALPERPVVANPLWPETLYEDYCERFAAPEGAP